MIIRNNTGETLIFYSAHPHAEEPEFSTELKSGEEFDMPDLGILSIQKVKGVEEKELEDFIVVQEAVVQLQKRMDFIEGFLRNIAKDISRELLGESLKK